MPPIAENIPLVMAILAGIVWAVRQEGRINSMAIEVEAIEFDIKDIRSRHDALDNKVMEKLFEMKESLARIEGALGVHNNNKE